MDEDGTYVHRRDGLVYKRMFKGGICKKCNSKIPDKRKSLCDKCGEFVLDTNGYRPKLDHEKTIVDYAKEFIGLKGKKWK